MNIVVTYPEIQDFIVKKFKIRLEFSTINEKLMEMSYKPAALMPSVAVRFHVDAISADEICLSYDCGIAASLMIAGGVAYLEDKIPNGTEINTTDKRIIVCLRKIKGLDKMLSHMTVSDLMFEENSLIIRFTLLY